MTKSIKRGRAYIGAMAVLDPDDPRWSSVDELSAAAEEALADLPAASPAKRKPAKPQSIEDVRAKAWDKWNKAGGKRQIRE